MQSRFQKAIFRRSRAEHLADYLRTMILRHELTEPLPGIRDWCVQLGVGRSTLEQTIRILKAEGLVSVLPRRGIKLAPESTSVSATPRPRSVRWLFHGRNYPDRTVLMEILAAVEERLQFHEIQLRIERCDTARLRALHERGEHPNELLMLVSLPPALERLFADFRSSALVIGKPVEGVALPYISNDVPSAIRHAVTLLARRGYGRVCMAITDTTYAGMEADFRRICEESGTGVRGEIVRLPVEMPEQARAARRFSAQITGRLGLIALYPIPATMLISALLEHGIAVGNQVAVVAMNTTPQAVRAVPTPVCYPYPVDAFARAIVRAALHYFERGKLPRLRKQIPLEMARPR